MYKLMVTGVMLLLVGCSKPSPPPVEDLDGYIPQDLTSAQKQFIVQAALAEPTANIVKITPMPEMCTMLAEQVQAAGAAMMVMGDEGFEQMRKRYPGWTLRAMNQVQSATMTLATKCLG